jgi:hypothetical protein
MDKGIITEVFKHDDVNAHALRLPLLAECGRTLHGATSAVLFRTVVLSDDDAQFVNTTPTLDGSYVHDHQQGPGQALVQNIARYAPCVRTLIVTDPPYTLTHTPKRENTLFELESHEDESGDDEGADEDGIRPISGTRLEALFRGCTGLEELVWVSSVPPPDGICEASIFVMFTLLTHVHY